MAETTHFLTSQLPRAGITPITQQKLVRTEINICLKPSQSHLSWEYGIPRHSKLVPGKAVILRSFEFANTGQRSRECWPTRKGREEAQTLKQGWGIESALRTPERFISHSNSSLRQGLVKSVKQPGALSNNPLIVTA
jgi:hypothetical protein